MTEFLLLILYDLDKISSDILKSDHKSISFNVFMSNTNASNRVNENWNKVGYGNLTGHLLFGIAMLQQLSADYIPC